MSSVPLGVMLFAVSVHASPDSPGGLSVNVPATAAVTGGGLVVWAVTELAREELIPRTCRWCEPPAFDRHVRAQVVWSDPKVAGLLSDVLQLVVPVSLAGADLLFARDFGRASEDVLVSVEAMVFAAVATQAAKFAFARRNPAAWTAGARASPDDDRAFLSGHVTTSFAAAAAFGTVARLRGYPHWLAVYAVGFSGATAIGYLRMAADEHWLSDVVASAAAGTALGIAVPLLLHRSDQQPRLTVMPLSAAAAGLQLSGEF